MRDGFEHEEVASLGLTYRVLEREEIGKLPEIDRSEKIDGMYLLHAGKLECRPADYAVKGFHPADLQHLLDDLSDLFERGGIVFGALDGGKLVGIASLDIRWRGRLRDQLQLALLHVSQPYRRQGVATRLMNLVKERAKALGAKKLYISATETRNTVDFYMGAGAVLAQEVDPELYQREPEDIHLELPL